MKNMPFVDLATCDQTVKHEFYGNYYFFFQQDGVPLHYLQDV